MFYENFEQLRPSNRYRIKIRVPSLSLCPSNSSNPGHQNPVLLKNTSASARRDQTFSPPLIPKGPTLEFPGLGLLVFEPNCAGGRGLVLEGVGKLPVERGRWLGIEGHTMTPDTFSIYHHFSNENSGYRFSVATEAAELVEKILLWPQPIRRAAIGLWCGEVGLRPCKFWDTAALLLTAQPGGGGDMSAFRQQITEQCLTGFPTCAQPPIVPGLPQSLSSSFNHKAPSGDAFDPMQLVEALADIPSEWPLTPVKDKRPLRPHWATEPTLSRGNLTHQLLNSTAIEGDRGEYTQQWDGFGVRTGNGLIGVDQDGPVAAALLTKLSGGDIPPTPVWTSGKDNRLGMLYRLSEATQALLPAGWGGKKLIPIPGQELDFRYEGKMQVLPPSAHPETERYQWIVSPQDAEVAPAPEWLEQLVRQWVTRSNAPVTLQKRPNPVTPGEWPLLPPIALTGPGETNDAIRQMCNWGYNKLGKQSIEELAAYITTNAPKLPGWVEFASVKSKRDLAKDSNGWGQRWAKSCVGYWESPKAQHKHTAPNTQWQDWLQEDSISRMQWCIDRAKELGQKFFSQNELLRQFSEWSKEKFGRGFGRSTLLKAKEVWGSLVGGASLEATPQPKLVIQNVPNASVPYQQENQGFEGGTGFLQTPEPEVDPQAEPQAAATQPIQEFRKGDRVIVNDGTWLPYCGQMATVQARVKDVGGNTCYRLDIDYQGRRGTKGRKFEALPCFLKPLPETVTSGKDSQWQSTSPTSPQGTEGGQRDNSSSIRAHWTALQVALGDGNPFIGGEWEVSSADIGKAAFKRLRDYLAQGGAAYA